MYIRQNGVPNLPIPNMKRGEFLWQNRDLINLINYYSACKINPNRIQLLQHYATVNNNM